MSNLTFSLDTQKDSTAAQWSRLVSMQRNVLVGLKRLAIEKTKGRQQLDVGSAPCCGLKCLGREANSRL